MTDKISDFETISIVVPCRNERLHIRGCIESIYAMDGMSHVTEVIVVDGESDDGTRAILSELKNRYSNLVVVSNQKRITPCAMNIGIAHATGDRIAILGAHCRYPKNYIAKCSEVARSTGADNVGGAVAAEGRTSMQKAIALAHHCPLVVGNAPWHKKSYSGYVDTVFGGFYKRNVFEQIGGFDERFIRNQDDELNLRLTMAGGRIFLSNEICSTYVPRDSLMRLLKQYAQYGYWKTRILKKHMRFASLRHYVAGIAAFGGACTALAAVTNGTARLAIGVGGVCYAILLVAVGVWGFKQAGVSMMIRMIPVTTCYHFGYGAGVIWGTISLWLPWRRQANELWRITN